jgi:hypothetical protein
VHILKNRFYWRDRLLWRGIGTGILTDIDVAARMIGLTFLTHLNLFQASRRRHLAARDTDIVLSNEILAASRMDEKAIWARLRTSPEGLDPAEAEARLASVGPNLVTREGRPSVL